MADVSERYQGIALSSRGQPIPNATVAVLTQPAVTSTQPGSPLATLATSTSTSSGGANPLTADANGNFFFYAAPGLYTIQIYSPQISGQFVQPDTIVGTAGVANLGTLTVKNLENILYVDATNNQGWAGTDVGGWINSAVASLPANGGKVIVAAGSYNFATQISISSSTFNVTIEGAGGSRASGTGATKLTWTGGATPAINIAGIGITLRGIQLNNTGTGTIGVQLAACLFVTFDDFSIDRPSVAFSTAGIQTNTGIVSYVFFIRTKLENAAPVNYDIDHANLVVFDKSLANASNNTVTTSIRVGNTGVCNGFYFVNGSDMEHIGAPTSAISMDLINVNVAVIRDSFAETNQNNQLIIRTGASSNSVLVEGNFFQGNSVGNFAIQFNGGAGYTVRGNFFINFVTAAINNTSVTSANVFNNVLSSTPIVFNSGTGIALIPDVNAQEFGNSSKAWNARLNLAQFFRSGGNPASPDIIGNGAAVVIGDANGVKTGTGAAFTDSGGLSYTKTITSGTSTLTANAALGAVTSQAAITTTATGAATTDSIEWSYASAPGAGDSLCILSAYVTSGNVNFVRSNPTAAAQNVSALVINWRVIR